MRTLNSLKNIIGNIANNILLNLLRFISRLVFIKVLSEVYLGVNGLLSNVLGLLALSELGISTAISYSLYKPLADNNSTKIKKLMCFYQKAYRIIAIIVLVFGIILLPFLPWFIKDPSGIENLTLIYLIFLGNMVIGYFFSYKRTLITADQKSYKIMPIIMFYNFLTTFLQIIVLLLFHNYIVYLLMQTICIVLENLTVNHYINKEYPLLKENMRGLHLDKKEFNTITTNVKALMLHKVASYILSATDNIVISKFIGIVVVGIYSNYVLIHSAISNFIYMFVSNVTASFGNLVAEGNKEKSYKVFKEMNFISFGLYGVSAICLLFTFNPFIELVFGTKFVLPFMVVVLIMVNYYLLGINQVPVTVQAAAGVYKYDQYVPLIEGTVNLIISIILVNYIGITGVLLGTLISYLIPLIVKPCVIFKHVFEKSVFHYFKTFLFQIIILIISYFILLGLTSIITVNSLLLQMIINFVLALLIPTLIIILLYSKSEEFKSMLNRIKFVVAKVRK